MAASDENGNDPTTTTATRRDTDATRAPNSATTTRDTKYVLRFTCIDGAAYHGARASFFDFVHRMLMAIVLLSSSTTIAGMAGLELFKPWLPWAGLAPLLASTLDLVISPGLKAQTHATLRSRYFELLADIEEIDFSARTHDRWTAALNRIYAQEPPTAYRAIKAMAYNVATDALWSEDEAAKRRLKLSFWDRWTGQLFPKTSKTYKPNC